MARRCDLVQLQPSLAQGREPRGEPRCAVSTDVASEPVVVEGLAEIVDDRAVIERLTAIWNEKYDTDTPVDFFASPDNACIRVAPVRVIGLSEANFNGSPTRWEMT